MQISTTQTFRTSRLKAIGYFTLSALFVIVGSWMVINGDALGWLPVIFFGLCAFVFALMLLPNCSYLRLDTDGLTMCSLFRSHFYRWGDIGPFTVARVSANRMVVFNFSETYKGSTRARRISSALAGYEGALPDSYGWDLEDLAALLNEYRANNTKESLSQATAPETAKD